MASTSGESKIDTKLFITTAETVGSVSKELDSSFQDWAKTMQTLRGSWLGDTSDDIKNTVEAVQKSASYLLQMLGGYRTALNEIAGVYDKTEQNVTETGKSLKFEKTMR